MAGPPVGEVERGRPVRGAVSLPRGAVQAQAGPGTAGNAWRAGEGATQLT